MMGREGHFPGDTEPYDAVILDIRLAEMDGVTVGEMARQAASCRCDIDRSVTLEATRFQALMPGGPMNYVTKHSCPPEKESAGSAFVRRDPPASGHSPHRKCLRPVRALNHRLRKPSVDGVHLKLTSHEIPALVPTLMHLWARWCRATTNLVRAHVDQDFDRVQTR